jgi:phospholipid/cholesterol/gamma-HCH transport system permease protein
VISKILGIPIKAIESTEAAVKRWALETQNLFFFSLKMLSALFGRPFYFKETIEQMYLIGVGSLYLVALAGLFSGQGFAVALTQELSEFGAKDYLGRSMAIAMIRELGPSVTGLMVAARVASGITAEIGAMRSSNQLDAMVAFGIDPLKKLAVPRLLALMVMLPALTIACDVIAISGGSLVALYVGKTSTTLYWATVIDRLTFGNMLLGLSKPVFFSFFVAFISCFKGFSAEGGTKGVGKATTESVVASSITILILGFLITKVFHGFIKGYL